MTVLRYQYPQWPDGFYGTEVVTELGIFDFDLQDVLNVLAEEQEQMARLPHLYGTLTREARAARLLKNIEWLKHQSQHSPDVVVWHHATRDWPIEKLESARKKWENDSLRLLFGPSDSPLQQSLASTFGIKLLDGEDAAEAGKPYKEAEPFEDSEFGDCLVPLIYKQQYLKVLCPSCEASYLPQQCAVEAWRAPGMAGEKLVCPRSHTLHSHMTRMVKERPPRK